MRFNVSTHSRLKAAGRYFYKIMIFIEIVSTHSRLKAAGVTENINSSKASGFNTQPPEGGWTRD